MPLGVPVSGARSRETPGRSAMFALIAVGLGVGFLCGCCGIGGFLLIPALAYAVGMDIHTAMGTALFSFIFTGLWGIWLY